MVWSALLLVSLVGASEPAEIYCNIVKAGPALDCQWVGKEKRVMTADDISNYLDQAKVEAYITVKSRKGRERTFLIDGRSKQFKKLGDLPTSAPISEVNRFKSDLFTDIERRAIKISDELDSQLDTADLIQSDPSITYDKNRKEQRLLTTELEGFRKNRDKLCTSTPGFEQLSKSNLGLQQTLSNIIQAYSTPGTCLDDFKIFKDRDGAVDLRQLNAVPEKYKLQCQRK